MRPCPEHLLAARALGPRPCKKDFAFVASLVAVAVMPAMFLSRSFVLDTDAFARHVIESGR